MINLDRKIIAVLRSWHLLPDESVRIGGDIRWQAVFFIGIAGSGKSYIKTKKYLKYFNFKEVDADEIKKTHPDYDPENPNLLHDWSKEIAESQFQEIINSDTGNSVVVDGTGSHPDIVIRRIQQAQEKGYRTYLVYVYVPIEVSIYRNRNRKRFVPEAVILNQDKIMSDSFRRLKSIVDQFKVILNYEPEELKNAEKDIVIYPPPQKIRPPRPGSVDYGKERAAMNKILANEIVRIAKIVMAGWDEVES